MKSGEREFINCRLFRCNLNKISFKFIEINFELLFFFSVLMFPQNTRQWNYHLFEIEYCTTFPAFAFSHVLGQRVNEP